jgi:hypothetical protein
MPIEVHPLTTAEIPGAIEVIQQAFADDPYFQWVFDKEKVCILCCPPLLSFLYAGLACCSRYTPVYIY